MIFNAMTRLLLKSVEFLKGRNWNTFNSINKDSYLGDRQSLQIKNFLTKIIATLFVSTFPVGHAGGFQRIGGAPGAPAPIGNYDVEHVVNAYTAPGAVRGNQHIFVDNTGGLPTENNKDIDNFINTINNETTLTGPDYIDINEDIQQVESYMQNQLTSIAQGLNDVNISNVANIRAYLTTIINSGIDKNNIYYYMLMKIITGKKNMTPAYNSSLQGLFTPGAGGADFDYRNIITNLTADLRSTEQQLLITILERDFNRLMQDDTNRQNPMETLGKSIKDNAIVNALRVIT